MVALLVGAACGFAPVYGPGAVGDRLYGNTSIPEPENQETYMLVRELEQRLGRAPDNARYEMVVALRTASEGQAVTAAGDITRFSIIGSADFQLKPRAGGPVIAEGSVRNFVGYSAIGSTVETLASERDAHERLMIILADQIVAQVSAKAEFSE